MLLPSAAGERVCSSHPVRLTALLPTDGPYRQRQRASIYHVFAKQLVSEGKAYPCFCTEEELTAMREKQEAMKVNFGYYGEFAMWRDRSIEDIQAQFSAGNPWVLRFRSTGSIENQFKFDDLVKGKLRDVSCGATV